VVVEDVEAAGERTPNQQVLTHVLRVKPALHYSQKHWSEDLSDCHHEEVDEDIAWEVLDVVAYEVVVEGSVDPQSYCCDQTTLVLRTVPQYLDVLKETMLVLYIIFLFVL